MVPITHELEASLRPPTLAGIGFPLELQLKFNLKLFYRKEVRKWGRNCGQEANNQ